MPKKEDESTSRVHLMLFDEDIEWVHLNFDGNIGFSRAIRNMVRLMRRNMEEKARAKGKHIEPPEDLA